MLYQSVFQEFAKAWRAFWQNLDYLAFWGWIILVIGALCVFALILFTEYKRKERDSVKFTAIMILVSAVFLGLGLHMILTASGFW